MPVHPSGGQMVTFAIERDEDEDYGKWIWVGVRVHDTLRKLCARRGHPEEVHIVGVKNKIRSRDAILLHKPKRKRDKTRLKVPGHFAYSASFHALAGENPPTITDGYAKFETVDRPERTGMTKFQGYGPMTMDVDIQFENVLGNSRSDLDGDMAQLEQMGGRGNFPGAAVGPPPIIRLSTTDGSGRIVPLLPQNVQWSSNNPTAPLWRITGIQWGEALRDVHGNRIRQKATVTVQQHTHVSLKSRSVSTRRKGKKTKKKKSKK